MAMEVGTKMNTTVATFGEFEIVADPYSYSVVRNSGKIGKDGRPDRKFLAYYGSLDKAIIGCKKEFTRAEILKHNKLSLDETVSIIIRCNNHFEALVKNAFEGVET